MGTINKTIYEAPTIHLKQVMMESDIMAASGDSTSKDTQVQLETTEHETGNSFIITGDWE